MIWISPGRHPPTLQQSQFDSKALCLIVFANHHDVSWCVKMCQSCWGRHFAWKWFQGFWMMIWFENSEDPHRSLAFKICAASICSRWLGFALEVVCQRSGQQVHASVNFGRCTITFNNLCVCLYHTRKAVSKLIAHCIPAASDSTVPHGTVRLRVFLHGRVWKYCQIIQILLSLRDWSPLQRPPFSRFRQMSI